MDSKDQRFQVWPFSREASTIVTKNDTSIDFVFHLIFSIILYIFFYKLCELMAMNGCYNEM